MKTHEEQPEGEFGDERLSVRHVWLSNLLKEHPDASFPSLVDSPSELEAIYRFLGNPRVTYERLMEAHFEATAREIASGKGAVIIHDPTAFSFGGEVRRKGLGRMGTHGNSQGFYGQFALAVSDDVSRRPIGLIAFMPIFLKGPPVPRGSRLAFKRRPNRKVLAWGELVQRVQERLPENIKPIHVMDREADHYELFENLVNKGCRFVIRLRHDRYIYEAGAPAPQHLRTMMEGVESALVREVPLSVRGRKKAPNSKIHPPRNARMAWLHCRAKTVVVGRPDARCSDATTMTLTLNAVQVYEPAPPNGEAPVEWLLLTTEPVNTKEELAAVIDVYRTRWVIEEYFKCLKTGCAYEARQLESSDGLLNALGVLAPLAVDLLRIRNVARDKPDAPAKEVATPTQIEVLRHFSKRHWLPLRPTARDVCLAIAGLGGHLKNNGDPGWLVLHRGYQKLLAYEAGWCAARAQRCDES